MVALGQQLDISLMEYDEWQSWLRRVSGKHPIPHIFQPPWRSSGGST